MFDKNKESSMGDERVDGDRQKGRESKNRLKQTTMIHCGSAEGSLRQESRRVEIERRVQMEERFNKYRSGCFSEQRYRLSSEPTDIEARPTLKVRALSNRRHEQATDGCNVWIGIPFRVLRDIRRLRTTNPTQINFVHQRKENKRHEQLDIRPDRNQCSSRRDLDKP